MDDKNVVKNKKAAFRRLVEYLKPYKKPVAVGVTTNIVLALASLAPGLIIGKLIVDRVIGNKLHLGHPARLHLLFISALALLLANGLCALCVYIRSVVMHVLGERVILDIRKHVYSRLQLLSVSYFDNRETGEIMSRITNDSEVVEEFITHAADTLISDALRLVALANEALRDCRG